MMKKKKTYIPCTFKKGGPGGPTLNIIFIKYLFYSICYSNSETCRENDFTILEKIIFKKYAVLN